jgi:hypothetical protein
MKLITRVILSVLVLTCSINTYGSDHDFCDYLEKNTHVFSPAEQRSISIKTHEEVTTTHALLGISLSAIGSLYLAKSIATGYVAFKSIRSLIYLRDLHPTSKYHSAVTFTSYLNSLLLDMALKDSFKSAAIGIPISYIGFKELEKSGLTKSIKNSLAVILRN